MGLPPERFSIRFGVRPEVPEARVDEVPYACKSQLVEAIDRLRQSSLPGATTLGPRLADALGKPFEAPGDMPKIRALLVNLDWWEFYDACEILLRMARQIELVVNEIEAIFTGNRLPYRMTAGGIEWRLNEPAGEAVAAANRILIEDIRFVGPAQQWDRARSLLNRRPPDAENAIKDSVGALEGVARILSGQENQTLGQIIGPLCQALV